MNTLDWRNLLALALKMEERGRDFYLRLADKAHTEESAVILRNLAEEEEEHAKLFRRGLPAVAEAFGAEQVKYLQALGNDDPFARDDEALGDPRQAMGIAIEAEKQSILFYSELAELAADDPATKEVLAKLLREEKLHLIELRERLEEDWE